MVAFAEAAIPYAERGLAVVPVDMRPGDRNKCPLVPYGGGRHPLSPKALHRFGQRRPDAGVALNVGLSNHVLVDIDSNDAGLAGEVFDRFGGTNVTARTPSGGRHGWFRDPDQIARSTNLRNSENLPVDIKAGRALGIVPPTYNPVRNDAYCPIGMTNSEFISALLDAPDVDPAGLPISQALWSVPVGGRNDAAFERVRILANNAASLEALLDQMRDWNAGTCEVPLSDAEIANKCRWAWKRKEQGALYLSSARYTPIVSLTETKELMSNPYAGMLLNWLRCHHPLHHVFKVSPKGIAPHIGWNEKTVRTHRDWLIHNGYLERVGPDLETGAPQFKLTAPRGVHQTDPIEHKHPPLAVGASER
jgi:hypothetical protein